MHNRLLGKQIFNNARNKMFHTMSTIIVLSLFSTWSINAQSLQSGIDDSNLIDEFIKAKGYNNAIVFDANNIKQYWSDTIVLSQEKNIKLLLENDDKSKTHISPPLKIQLANVTEHYDCKVDLFAEKKDFSYVIQNNQSETISAPCDDESFIQYSVKSTTFHLDDTNDFSFNFLFSSEKSDTLAIKKIVLSFSENTQSRYSGSSGFDQLIKEIEDKGVLIPENDIRYIVSERHHKLFIMIPNENTEKYRFFYHIYPKDKSDLYADREKYGFNNMDKDVNNIKAFVPKNALSKTPYKIIQVVLPSYYYSILRIGQFDGGKNIWIIELKDNSFKH